jgi:large subunit ribosomal protein L32
MAVPFRKVSKTRKRQRRTHYKIEANGTTKCSNCGAIIRPHRVCTECGYYKGKSILTKKEAAK